MKHFLNLLIVVFVCGCTMNQNLLVPQNRLEVVGCSLPIIKSISLVPKNCGNDNLLALANKKIERLNPIFVSIKEFSIVGVRGENSSKDSKVSDLWKRYQNISDKDTAVFGIGFNGKSEKDNSWKCSYIVGTEISDNEIICEEFEEVTFPTHSFIKFTHREGLESINKTYQEIYNYLDNCEGYGYDSENSFEIECFRKVKNGQVIDIYLPVVNM